MLCTGSDWWVRGGCESGGLSPLNHHPQQASKQAADKHLDMSTNAPHIPAAAQPPAAPPTPASKTGTKKAPVAIDALTASLQASKLAEAGAAAFAQLSAAAIKHRLLHPQVNSTEAERIPEHAPAAAAHDEEHDQAYQVAPPLSTYIHDRVWAEGGEFVLHITSTDLTFTQPELDTALANIAQAAGDVECQATNLLVEPHATHSSAKVMLRRTPNGAQELIELRIAVVGNGESQSASPQRQLRVSDSPHA